MSRPVCRIGDADIPHCSPMVRATGLPNVFVNGRPASCQFDLNTPHRGAIGVHCFGAASPMHVSYIAIGSVTVFSNSRGQGRIADLLISAGVPPICTAVAQGSASVFAGG